MKAIKTLVLLLCIFSISSCGYTHKSVMEEKYKTIYVQTFKNKIDITDKITSRNPYKMYRPGSEQDLTNAVIHRFMYDGTFQVTREKEADLLMTGDLVDYVRAPVRYDDNDNIIEYRVSLVVNICVKDSKTGEYILNNQKISADSNYITTGQYEATETDALNLATDDAARRIVNKTTEAGW